MDDTAALGLAGSAGGQGARGAGLLAGMSMWGMVAALVFSGAGYFYLKRGRAEGDVAKMGCGIVLMVYPYFVTDAVYTVLIGAALMAAPYLLQRF